MRLELFITDLLFRHDCVIVPDLGAFITRSLPAEIASATHMFRPSRKQLAFNGSLKENDGLLIGYVSRVNHCSYEQARQQVKVSVGHWRHELAAGKKLRLEHIGQLYLSPQGSLQFTPTLESNFDLDSYGNGIFHLPPLEKGLRNEKEGTSKKAPTIVAASEMSPEKAVVLRRSSSGWKWAAVIAPVMILSAAAWWKRDNIGDVFRSRSVVGPDILHGHEPSSADESSFQGVQGLKRKSVIPFSDGLREPDTKESKEQEALSTEEVIPTQSISSSPSEVAGAKNEVEKGVAPSAIPEEASAPEAKSEATTKPKFQRRAATPSSYYIIVGSFRERGNTNRMIKQLRAQGYTNASVAPGGGLSRVSAVHFASRAEALEALQKIKQDIETSAWIYRP